MRADAHYVDQLDTRVDRMPVRMIDTSAIEAGQLGDVPSPAFVDSIKRFGVLQPLLVSAHANRYRIIAGRRRLAAAMAAGLRDVPCLVQHVDVEQAEQMALASNLPAARPRPATPAATSSPDKPGITAELTNIVSALVSCAELLASPSTLTQAVAADLVRAEAARALDSLVAIRVLRDEMPISRAPVAVQTLLDRLSSAAALERHIRGVVLHIDAASDARATMVKADTRLFVSALSALVSAAGALVDSTGRSNDNRPAIPLRLRCSREADQVAFRVTQHAVELPAAWLARPFDIAWPIRNGAGALTQLQAARKVAQNHGGTLDVAATEAGTSFVMEIPIVVAGT
jgi:ParB-like chromosome segregation protein Spo0J